MKTLYHIGKYYEPGYLVLCPACNTAHFFSTEWSFNYDWESPSFSPSLDIQRPDGSRCHFVLKDGVMRFGKDSTHELRGQWVPLGDIPDSWNE